MKREFVMLAHKLDLDKVNICSWYLSEKLDGVRVFWDGGITNGLLCTQVPWANTTKHDRYLSAPVATGLWTRYGQPVIAPDWWTAELPKIPLDGEVTMGRGRFQETMSVIRSLTPTAKWEDVKFKVFDSPPHTEIFADAEIKTPNFKKKWSGITNWLSERGVPILKPRRYYETLDMLCKTIKGPHVEVLEQLQVPCNRQSSIDFVNYHLDEVVAAGGEGVMLRNPVSIWSPHRSRDLLKYKPYVDAEAEVLGYTFAKGTDMEKSITGRATDKLLGLMGSLRCRYNGIEFDLSGFTDAERQLESKPNCAPAYAYAAKHPGEVAPDWISNPKFPRGSQVTFRFRELTDDGKPKEARYWRVRNDLLACHNDVG